MSSARRRKLLQQRRKDNIERAELRERLQELSKPDPVLGHQLNEEGERYWQESELCKLILTKDEIWGVKEDRRGNLVAIQEDDHGDAATGLGSQKGGPGPRRLNFGLDSLENRELLFTQMPAVAVEDTSRLLSTARSTDELARLAEQVERAEVAERGNSDILQRVLDLRNASGKGIQVENKRRIIQHFGSRPEDERPGMDTGSVEVQGGFSARRGEARRRIALRKADRVRVRLTTLLAAHLPAAQWPS